MKKRFLSIYFPNWSVNLIQRTLPIGIQPRGTLLVSKVKDQLVVARACHKAKSIGVKEGSAFSLAKAFLPKAIVKEFNPVEDFKSLYRLGVWAFHFSPITGLDPEVITAYKELSIRDVDSRHYGINIDITGTQRVHKGEENLVHRIKEKLSKGRFEAKIAIAPTLGAAWAFSRYALEKIVICENSSLKTSLAPLPVESLRLNQEIVERLMQVGIKDIGTLFTIPRKSLFERYGNSCLYKIDQTMGSVPEAVFVIPTPQRWIVTRQFEVPLEDQKHLVDITVLLLHELVEKITEKKRKAKFFILLIEGEDSHGIPYRTVKEFSLLTASGKASHIISVIHPLIESLQILGPVYFIALTSKDTVKDSPIQKDISGSDVDESDIEELLNYLVARLGKDNVNTIEFCNSYIPEHSYAFKPIDELKEKDPSISYIQERPSYLLPQVQEVTAISALPDSHPAKIYWKNQELNIVKGYGPERIAHSWWQTSEINVSSRDYFKVQDHTGRWIWLFRDTHSYKWYIHGLWI